MPGRSFESQPLPFLSRQSFYPWLVVGVTCIGGFLGQLDASIVQLALPALKLAVGASVDDVRWVAIAYLLAYAGCLPLFGRVCEIFGRKLLYLLGFALFTVASLLCGLATDLTSLIVFRTLQGIGGSLLGANSIATLIKSTPSDKRGRAMGFLTASQAVGLSAGPVVGGILLDTLGWQWVFWAAVPFGLAAVMVGWLVLPQSTDLADSTDLDWHGALLLMPSLVLGVLVLNQTSVWPLLSPAMILSVVAAVVLLALFLRHERVAASPLVDLSLFGANAFTAGIVGVAMGYALMYGMFFLMSFALIHGLHESARLVGIKLAVIPIAIGLLASFAISLSERWGSRAVGVVGMGLCTAAIVTISGLALHPIGTLISGLSAFAVFGVGLGLFMASNTNATMEAAPASRAGTASALVNLMRALGSCIGISAASSMMSWRMRQLAGPDELDKLYFEGSRLLDGVESSLAVLVLFALIAAAGLLARPRSAIR